MKKLKSREILSIILILIYIIYFYIFCKYVVTHDLLIGVKSVSSKNILLAFTSDFFASLLFPILLIFVFRHDLKKFNLVFRHTLLQYVLIGFIILTFILHNDFSIGGLYRLFFYLIPVAFSEEFIFRGYLYNELKSNNRLFAIILSGLLWGIPHAILPGLIANKTILEFCLSMISEIGGGVLSGYYFIYLQEKSNSLFIPIFVHALLDYSAGPLSIIPALGTFIYLFIKNKRNKLVKHK